MKLKQRLVCGITAFMFTTFVIAYVCVTQGQVYLEGTGLDPENKFRFKLNDVAYAGAADLFRTSNRTDGNKNGILLRRQLDQSISRSGPNKTGSDPDFNNNNNGDKTNHGGELSKSAIKQNKVLNSEYLNRTRLEASSERNISFEPGKEVISVISAIRARPANLPEEGNFYNIPHKYPKFPAVQVANRSKFEALFRNFSASYVVPGQLQKHDHLVRYVRSSGWVDFKYYEPLHGFWTSRLHVEINTYDGISLLPYAWLPRSDGLNVDLWVEELGGYALSHRSHHLSVSQVLGHAIDHFFVLVPGPHLNRRQITYRRYERT